ncbi:hypothetical protein E1301_Tti022068 [Triplophysa tibetana]|uniref:Cytosolic phospholipase A2 gamma n=1 Tax=Triplophysa tibetana TaxID=1572043 RepID=A0A5A9P677_9TELE|nr:hypothetical protein E1301_Tti022068 [Triplophysa tibetana]
MKLLGSGGGEGSMLGLLGSLAELDKAGRLDCILYLRCMASLYQDSDWSTKLDSVREKIIQRLKGPGVGWFETALQLMKYYHEKDIFSLTDVWSVLLVTLFVKEVCVFFEISPYEAGYSLTGAFVDNSMFGSQFDKGSKIKDQPEMDMLYLQGLCGSCLADGEFIIELLLEKIKGLFNQVTHAKEAEFGKTSQEGTEDAGFQILVSLVEMHFSVLKEKDHSGHETTIRTKLKDILDAIFKCVMDWIWGRKYNFLYKMEGVHAAVLKSETRDYEDAGVALNSPYISMLRQERHVDLIISLDFMNGFQTLTYASEICEDLEIPFPEVDVSSEDPKKPKDFYVFEGKGEEPTVIHIPLFNTVNSDKVEEWSEKYTTFQGPYSADLIDPLLEVSGKNITNNKEKLVEEIQKIIDKKHKQKDN